MIVLAHTSIYIANDKFFIWDQKSSTADLDLDTLEKIYQVITQNMTYFPGPWDRYVELPKRELWGVLRQKAQSIWIQHQSRANQTIRFKRLVSGQDRILNKITKAYHCVDNLFSPSLITMPDDVYELILKNLLLQDLTATDGTNKVLHEASRREIVRRAPTFGWKGEDPKMAKIWFEAKIQVFRLMIHFDLVPNELYGPKKNKGIDVDKGFNWMVTDPVGYQDQVQTLLRRLGRSEYGMLRLNRKNLEYLLIAGLNPHYKPDRWQPLINWVIWRKEDVYEMVKVLLDHGVDPNLYIVWGNSPLKEAVLADDLSLVLLLLARGAKCKERVCYSYESLTVLALGSKVMTIEEKMQMGGLLFQHEAIGFAKGCLLDDSSYGLHDILRSGLGPNSRDAMGRTFLHLLLLYEEPPEKMDRYKMDRVVRKIKILVEYGAEGSIADNQGKTPRQLAQDLKYGKDVLRLLD